MIKKYRKTSTIFAEPFDESNKLISKHHMIAKNGTYYLPTKEDALKIIDEGLVGYGF